MAEHREHVDKRMMKELNRRVFIPLVLCLGARYAVKPYMGRYDDETKTVRWGLGHKEGGDKRHRTSLVYRGITYRDGEKKIGTKRATVLSRELVWSRKHDNRLVQNRETVNEKKFKSNETFNKIRTFSSADLMQSFSSTVKGEIMGVGASVTSTTQAKLHTEVETEKFNHQKEETVIDCGAVVEFPGPLYRTDLDANGVVIGRTLVEEGEVWLTECAVECIQTIQPFTMEGTWDASIELNLEDWAGNYGIMPGGEHDNVLKFGGLDELISFMQKDLVLQYPWSSKLKLNRDARNGLNWLLDESNRYVGPVEWDQVSENWNCGALEPSIIEA